MTQPNPPRTAAGETAFNDASMDGALAASSPFHVAADGVTLVGERYDALDPAGLAVLLHGGGQTRHSWRSTARTLQQDGWTALTVDARGHGDSGRSPDGDYSMDALVGDLADLVATLDEPPLLIGASMGGLTSLLALGESWLTARGLVLVDVAPRVEPAGLKRIQSFMSGHPDGFTSLEEVADAIAEYNPHRPRPRNVDGLRKNVRLGEDGRWRWHWDPAFLTIRDEPTRALRQKRLMAAAGRVRVPTMIIRGDQSDVVSADGAAELVRMIPGAAESVVAGAGHMVAGDDNAVFGRELLAFADSLPPVQG